MNMNMNTTIRTTSTRTLRTTLAAVAASLVCAGAALPLNAAAAGAQLQPHALQVAAACNNCGRIESVQAVKQRGQGSGLGAAGGAVVGGLLGNQVGGGHGRQLATVAGAVGGAVAGNHVEGNMKATTSYDIRVRLDNGKYRSFHQSRAPQWRKGDRVKIVNGSLRAIH